MTKASKVLLAASLIGIAVHGACSLIKAIKGEKDDKTEAVVDILDETVEESVDTIKTTIKGGTVMDVANTVMSFVKEHFGFNELKSKTELALQKNSPLTDIQKMYLAKTITWHRITVGTILGVVAVAYVMQGLQTADAIKAAISAK